jgi:hypothetical protein
VETNLEEVHLLKEETLDLVSRLKSIRQSDTLRRTSSSVDHDLEFWMC